MKKVVITLIAIILVVACAMSIVACKDKTNPLENCVLDLKSYVTEDFMLESSYGGYDLSWKSDNAAIVVSKIDGEWLARVNRPDEDTIVTLTVTANGYSRDYRVKVGAIDADEISMNYKFDMNRKTVGSDFALQRTWTYQGRTVTIDWSVTDETSKEYIQISEDGNTCLVTPSTVKQPVKINATFNYNGQSAPNTYDLTVYVDMEGLQLVDYWYHNTGISIDISGYVVSLAQEYKSGTVSVYVVNDDLTAGFYLYGINTTEATAAKLVPGVHVTATGTTNTLYNGLMETGSRTGNLVIDEDKDSIDIATTVKAIDDLVIGDLPETIYNESRLVSLSNWTVKSVVTDESKFDPAKTFTVMTLTKAGKDVTVAVSSKYLQGSYKASDETWNALCGLAKTYKAGDVVNVTGILSIYYEKWQLLPLNASAVTAGVADAEGTVYTGKLVGDAVAAVNAVLKAEGADTTIRADKVITIPTTSGDVSIAAELCGSSKTVAVDNNVVTVTVGKKDLATLKVTYTKGDFTSVQFITITSEVGEHVCAHVCSTCGKCTDPNCTESSCADKCEGHVKLVKVEAPFEEGKAYYFAINQAGLNKTLYAINKMNGFYIATSDALETAQNVYVEKDGENYRLYFTDGTTKTYISAKANGTYTNILLVNEDPISWIWDATNKCFKTVLQPEGKDAGEYFIGTSGTYNTFSLSSISNVSNATNYVAFLGEIKEGGDDPTPAHTCAHVCSTCGKCTDANCADPSCADKCAGHDNSKVLVKAEVPFEEGKAYYFAINQTNIDTTIYAVNDMDGYYGKTVDSLDAAEHVYVEKDGDNYRLYFTDGTTKTYISYAVSGTYVNYKLVTEDAKSWAWNTEKNVFETVEELTPDNKEAGHYYLGTYAKNKTVGISAPSYLATSFPAYLGEVKEGGDDPTPEHTCAHVCSTCGKCTDATCEDDACADKCQGHGDVGEKTEESLAIIANQGTQSEDKLSISWTADTFVVTNNKNTSKTDILTENYDHFRCYVGSTLEIAAKGDKQITKVVLTFMSTYSGAIDDYNIEGVTAVVEDSTIVVTVNGSASSLLFTMTKQLRVTNIVVYYGENGGDEPDPTPEHTCAHVCSTCGKCTDANCEDEACADKCAGHEAVVVTAAQAVELPDETKVIVTGVVTEINEKWNDKFSNITVTITDAEGNNLYVYRLATLVGIGDTITITGKVGSYNGSKQIAAGATATIDVAHVCTEWTEADCANAGKCVLCGKENAEIPALDHIDEDADGVCDRCSKNLSVSYATESLTIYAVDGALAEDALSISWTGENFTVTGTKNATNDIRTEDTDHFRCYAKSTLVISANGEEKIASVTITCVNASYANALAGALTTEGATATVDGTNVVITINADPVDSVNFTLAAQSRITEVVISYEA